MFRSVGTAIAKALFKEGTTKAQLMGYVWGGSEQSAM